MTAVLVGPEAEETTVFRAGSLGDCTGVCYVDSEEGRCTQLSTHLAVGMMSEELAHCSHWSGPRSYTRNSGSVCYHDGRRTCLRHLPSPDHPGPLNVEVDVPAHYCSSEIAALVCCDPRRRGLRLVGQLASQDFRNCALQMSYRDYHHGYLLRGHLSTDSPGLQGLLIHDCCRATRFEVCYGFLKFG